MKYFIIDLDVALGYKLEYRIENDTPDMFFEWLNTNIVPLLSLRVFHRSVAPARQRLHPRLAGAGSG